MHVVDEFTREALATECHRRIDPDHTVEILKRLVADIDPSSASRNPYVASFGGRVRDELSAIELFPCLAEAHVLIEDWRIDYNHHRPTQRFR